VFALTIVTLIAAQIQYNMYPQSKNDLGGGSSNSSCDSEHGRGGGQFEAHPRVGELGMVQTILYIAPNYILEIYHNPNIELPHAMLH
jgi:hypothetical protein